MPEYSSTTITPADAVKVPAMNGSTSGNFQLDALRSFILASKGAANGLASLDSSGKLDSSQIPDLADDVLVYASYATLPSPGTAGKIYITADDNVMYRWDPDLATPDYVELSVDLSDYATKTELAAEESAREAADSDLKNALTAVDHRVQNLEQAKGDYVAVDSDKGVITTPSGKGKWAVVEKLRGVSRVENQLGKARTSGFATRINDYSFSVSFSAGDTGTPKVSEDIPTISGHYYLIYMKEDSSANIRTFNSGIIRFNYASDIVNGVAYVYQGDGTTSYVQVTPADSGVGGSGNFTFLVRDLTQYFNTTDLSFLGATDSAKLATIQTYYPWLLEPSEYGTSLVDSVYEGVRSTSKNIFNIDWLLLMNGWSKSGNYYTGQVNADKTGINNKVESLNVYGRRVAVSIKGYNNTANNGLGVSFNYSDGTGETLYLSGTSENLRTRVSDANKTLIKLSITYGSGSVVSYISGMQIEYGTTATQITDYFTDTLSLPTPITLRSAGSVADTDELNVEVLVDGQRVKKRRQTINTVDIDLGALTENDWQGTSPVFYILTTDARFSNLTPAPNSTTAINAIIGKGIVPIARQTMYNDSTQNMVACDSGAFYIKLNSLGATPTKAQVVAFLNGCHLIGGAITPTATLLEPIQNPTILTESGGTISAQTEEPIDGNFSVGFITL